MKRYVTMTASIFAILVFFLMSVIGIFKGCSPDVCSFRAFIGAVTVYIVVTIAGNFIINMIIDEIVDSKIKKTMKND